MKFTTSAAIAALGLSTATLAAPAINRRGDYTTTTTTTNAYPSTTTDAYSYTTTPAYAYTTTTTTPAYDSTTTTTTPAYDYTTTTTTPAYTYSSTSSSYTYAPTPKATILPLYTSQYNGATGAVTFQNPNQGLVSRYDGNKGADISSLVTFDLDYSYADPKYTCQFVFDLTAPGSSTSGSNRADIFTSIKPAWVSTTSWPQGNLRDHHLGRVIASWGRAIQDPTVQAEGFTFPCSKIAGQYYGAEVVGVDTNVKMTWTPGSDGPKIVIYE